MSYPAEGGLPDMRNRIYRERGRVNLDANGLRRGDIDQHVGRPSGLDAVLIRPGVEADIPRVLDMGAKFHAAGKIKAGYDREAVAALLADLIHSDKGCLLVSDFGMIGGALAPAYCDPAHIVAIELFWWAEKGGLQLMQRFEDWARATGAREIRMTSLATLPRADALLRRKGFEPAEISYQKVI